MVCFLLALGFVAAFSSNNFYTNFVLVHKTHAHTHTTPSFAAAVSDAKPTWCFTQQMEKLSIIS